MERHDLPAAAGSLPEGGSEHQPGSEEAEVEQLVAWYFRSTPGSALERRRKVAERLMGRLRISRRAA
jgi:hypothetical protein